VINIKNNNWFKCSKCGKFISYNDFNLNLATWRIITPDSECSIEKFETLCKKCNK
jgi:hypothetical protein